MSQPVKRQKTEEESKEETEEKQEEDEELKGEEEAKDEDEVKEEEPKEPEQPKEFEEDAEPDAGPRVEGKVGFRVEDTTMNAMPSAFGSMLMPLTDGGLQFLLAGARANVGIKSGRYMFEMKIIEVMNLAEDPAARQRTPMPRSQLRVGLSTASGSLFLGETASSVCFDTEGAFIHDKKRNTTSQKFGGNDVVAVVLNLDNTSPNANTVSLFKNGERACQPQPLPDELIDKALYPAVTFKNLTLHYNFGPKPLCPLPFECRMVQDASLQNAIEAKQSPPPKDGKYEVIFPVSLPDEGTFDWLDWFLEQNPNYTELSDRAILSWAEKSGLWRPKGYNTKSSNDKPEMGFGIAMMDDSSIRRVIQAVAPVQQRNYVVMEVKSNLVKEERKEALTRWGSFKRTAAVMLGEPPAHLKKRAQAVMLKQKQEASDAEFKIKQTEEKRKKLLEKRQKQLEKDRKKALKQQKKMQEAMKKRIEDEKKKKAVEEVQEGEEAKDEEKVEEKEESEEEEDEKEDEEMEDATEQPPKVELSADDQKQWFRKGPVTDLTTYVLNTSFMKFTTPEKEEGFEDIRYEWHKNEESKKYLKQWVQDRKLTTRVEDLTPSEWFSNKWKDWQKSLQTWHGKQNQYKAAGAKKAQDAAAKEAKKAAKLAIKEAKEAKEAKEKAAAEAAAALAQDGMEEKKDGETMGEEEKKDEGKMEDDTKEEEKKEEEKKEEEEAEEEEEDEKDDGKADFEKLDVFGVEDILDVGAGEPLFSAFGFEDWTMMSLRFEFHLLTHAFRRDVNDPDRVGIHLEHLAFYYNKYFKKAMNTKFYGVDTVRELLELVRDTVVINRRNQVIEPQLPDDMESMGIFVMLTEESRRDRMRRVDLGDESAKLKLSQPQVPGVVPNAPLRPAAPAVARPFQVGTLAPQVAALRPATQAWFGAQTQRPITPAAVSAAAAAAAAFRPAANFGVAARPYPPAWRAFGR